MRVFSKRTPSQLGRCRYPRADVLFDAALVIVLLAACVLVVKNPLRYVADDALFYYQIALNIVAGRGVVFSLMPTNGFHPLWEAVCTLVAWVAPSKAAFQYFIALTGLGLNIAGLSMLRIAMARAQIPYPSAFIMLGAPYVLFVTQGMEGSLTVALLCSILVAFQRYSIRNVFSQLVLLYFLVGLLVLARLDLAILLIPVCLYIAFRHVLVRRSRPGAREVAVALAIAVTPLILYLLFNYVYFGDFRPISGLLKVANASRHYRNHSFTGVVSLYLGLSVVGSLFSCIEGTDWSRLILFLTAGLVLYAFYVLRLTSEAYAWYFYSFAVVAVCALGGVARSIGSSVPAATGVFRRHCLSAAPLALAIAACAFGVFLLHRYGKPVWRLPFDSYLGDNDLGGSARRVGIRRALVFDRPGESNRPTDDVHPRSQ
jgi:lipoprotein signal peptidase